MAASGMPYQCSMLVVPNWMSSQALVSSTPAWCAMRSPPLCASSSMAAMMSRSRPRMRMRAPPALLLRVGVGGDQSVQDVFACGVYDVIGKYVLPGLIMAHAHLQEE